MAYQRRTRVLSSSLGLSQNQSGQINLTRYVGTDDGPWITRNPPKVCDLVGFTRDEARRMLDELTAYLGDKP